MALRHSAVWRRAVVGLVVGVIAGFLFEHYWRTVAYSVGIGVVFGLAQDLLSRLRNKRRLG